jgi:type II secretory pathway pseudopilin PulG
MDSTSSRGFTLFETLIATGILVTVLAGVAQLFILSTRLTREAGASGLALVAAQEKLESLRGKAFGYGAAGESITDPALEITGADSLAEDVESYVDALDQDGSAVEDPADAAYVRRWRVSAIDEAPPPSILIEVCVFRAPVGGPTPEACLSAIRTRQP